MGNIFPKLWGRPKSADRLYLLLFVLRCGHCPTKQVKLYPNNKLWITKDLKQCLKNKKVAFLQGVKHRMKECNRELRRKTILAKLHYKNKVEEKFTTGNAREAWQGLKGHFRGKWIWDMFGMITSWNVSCGAHKPHIDAFFSWLFLVDSIKTL